MKKLATIVFLAIPAQTFAAACPEIENDLDRLACYDIESGRTSVVEVIAEEADKDSSSPPSKGLWLIRQKTSDFKDTKDIYLTLLSENTLSCQRFGEPQKASIMVRCMENTTAIFINTDCHMASGHGGYGNVEYRIDNRKAGNRGFEASTDNSALGLWSGGKSIPFIKSMLGGKEMIVRFTPFSSSPVTAKFEIDGLDEAIKPLRKECGW